MTDGAGLPHAIVIADEEQRSETGEPSLQSGLGDLLSGKVDALVDDLHARIAGSQRHLLGAVGVTVDHRLSDQDLHPVPKFLGDLVDPLVHLLEQLRVAGRGGFADPGGLAVVTGRIAQDARPLAGRGRPWRLRSSSA